MNKDHKPCPDNERIDLSGANLSYTGTIGIDLRGANLCGADLSGITGIFQKGEDE